MSKKHEVFGNTSKEEEQQLTREARLQYDQDKFQEAQGNWNSYTDAQKDFVKAEGNRIYQELADALEAGKSVDDAEVQGLFAQWHEHLRYFYEPTLDLLAGLGQMYNSSPDFMANFQKLHPDLPAFLEAGIAHYVDELETAELERMLAEDDADERTKRLSK
ncbi:MAG: TipAS antibiotic-recognition domain-containing protein [Chloroflexota bacterium]